MLRNIERTKDGMDSLIDRTRDAVVSVADRAEHGIEATAERVVEQAHLAGETVRGRAAAASLGAHQRVDGVAQAIDRGYVRARGDLSRAAAATTEFVTENPGKALLLAAAAGFLVGTVVHRQRARA
jgi:ElaB/YqjD/DUF883 family membrane-anchored ribosome-binding protein